MSRCRRIGAARMLGFGRCRQRRPGRRTCPRPLKTWEASKPYIVEPFAKRGELDQGILRFTWYSLVAGRQGLRARAADRHAARLLPRAVEALHEELRPDHPDAAPGLAAGVAAARAWCCSRSREPAALFTIAICAMWPTVLNTAVGVRSIPQDYLNVAKVLKLSRTKTLLQGPAARDAAVHVHRLPALSLGIAWLVIVAAEMLTGAPGVGGFLWQEYNSLIYEHIILCILTIGVVGLRARPADERWWRPRFEGRADHGVPRTRRRRQESTAKRTRAPRCCATSTWRSSAASSSPSSATPAPARPR